MVGIAEGGEGILTSDSTCCRTGKEVDHAMSYMNLEPDSCSMEEICVRLAC